MYEYFTYTANCKHKLLSFDKIEKEQRPNHELMMEKHVDYQHNDFF